MQGRCSHLAHGCPLSVPARLVAAQAAQQQCGGTPQPRSLRGKRHSRPQRGRLQLCRTAQLARSVSGRSFVSIDNKADPECTVISVEGSSRQNLIGAVATAFRDLDIDIRQVRGCRKGSAPAAGQRAAAGAHRVAGGCRWSLPATAPSRTVTMYWCAHAVIRALLSRSRGWHMCNRCGRQDGAHSSQRGAAASQPPADASCSPARLTRQRAQADGKKISGDEELGEIRTSLNTLMAGRTQGKRPETGPTSAKATDSKKAYLYSLLGALLLWEHRAGRSPGLSPAAQHGRAAAAAAAAGQGTSRHSGTLACMLPVEHRKQTMLRPAPSAGRRACSR